MGGGEPSRVKNESGKYYHVQRIRYVEETKIFYIVRTLDSELNAIQTDTVYLDLPEEAGKGLFGGLKILPLDDGYVSFDGKQNGNQHHYQITYWNEVLEVENTVSLDLSALLPTFPTGVTLNYIDEEKIILRFSYSINGESTIIAIILDHQGNVLRTFDYKSPEGEEYIYFTSFYNEYVGCPSFCGYRIEDNEDVYLDIVEVCGDTSSLRLSFHLKPNNTTMLPLMVQLLENNDIIMSGWVAKDTLLEDDMESRFYHQGVLHLLFDATTIGLTDTEEVDSHTAARISVYPNPSTGKIYIQDIPILEKDVTVTAVYDVHGRRVYYDTSFTGEIDISSLPQGGYILVIEAKDGSLYPSKFEKL